MRVAIVSDIHGNRHAFEAVLADAASAGVDEVWSLGDLVGYGAEPDACVALAAEVCAVNLAGNHDLAVTGALSLDEFSSGAAAAAAWTRQVIDPRARDWLAGLAGTGEAHGIGLYHASPRDPVWEYVVSLEAAAAGMDAAGQRVAFVGHSHVALAFRRAPGGEVAGYKRAGGTAALTGDGAQWLLNPGSVGQPRDGDPRAAWVELDLESGRASWRRVEYDLEGAAQAILAAGLPESLAARLAAGR